MKERNVCILQLKDDTKDKLLKTVVNPTNYQYKTAMKNPLNKVNGRSHDNCRRMILITFSVGLNQADGDRDRTQVQERRSLPYQKHY